MSQESVLEEIKQERAYQDSKWGIGFDDNNKESDWLSYIDKYMHRDDYDFRKRMVKVAALAVAAVETYDRNK